MSVKISIPRVVGLDGVMLSIALQSIRHTMVIVALNGFYVKNSSLTYDVVSMYL